MIVHLVHAGTNEVVAEYGDWPYSTLPREDERIILPTSSWEVTTVIYLPEEKLVWVGVRPFSEVVAEREELRAELAKLNLDSEEYNECDEDAGRNDED